MLSSVPPSVARETSPLVGGVASNLLEEVWFGEDDPAAARQKATASLAAQLAFVQGLRPFPVAASRLMHLLADPDFDKEVVVGVIESDPALAVKIVAVANSPLFRTRLPCRSVADALKRLGAKNLRDIAVGVSAMSMFSDSEGIAVSIRDHCVGVGAAARIIAELRLPKEASTLFLAGLLHDLGKLLLLQSGELTYQSGVVEESHVAEREQLGYDHAVLGGKVLKLWRIPDPISDVVLLHHQPSRALDQDPDLGVMVAILRSADRIDHALARTGDLSDETLRDLCGDTSWYFTDLSAGDLRQLWPSMREARDETLAALIA